MGVRAGKNPKEPVTFFFLKLCRRPYIDIYHKFRLNCWQEYTCEPDQQRSMYFWWDWWVNDAFLCPYIVYDSLYIHMTAQNKCTSCFGKLCPPVMIPLRYALIAKKIWQAFDLAHFLEALCHYRCSELAAAQDLVPWALFMATDVGNHWSTKNAPPKTNMEPPKIGGWGRCFSFFQGGIFSFHDSFLGS